MSKPALILETVLAHEKNRPDFVYMTQPIGNGQVIDYTWRETLKQARSMAAYIKAQNLAPKEDKTRCGNLSIQPRCPK